jgi:hypothetical protein
MGALSVTNFMGNKIGKEQLAKLQEIMRSKPNLVSLCGIAGDATGADLSGLGMDAGGAAILASELPDKGGAISKLIFNGGVTERGRWVRGGTATLESSMTEANFSNKKLGVSGAVIISAWLSSGKDKGALTSLNLASNNIGQMVPPAGWTMVGAGWKDSQGKYRSSDEAPPPGSNPEGVIALADAIRDMRALSLLSLTDNSIGEARVQKFKEMYGSRNISLLIN